MDIKETVPEGYKRDHRGSLVPLDMIKEIDRLRDALVLEIANKSQEYSRILNEFKSRTMADIQAFIELSAEKYKTYYGGEKGNVQLLSFDGEYKIIRAINDNITFDERLQIAKKLVDECIQVWSEGLNSTDFPGLAHIKVLVGHAFQVDKTGKLNIDRILGLRRLDIKDDKWKQAMEAISDSIQVLGSKAYLRVYKRDKYGKYQQINLDLAAV